VNPGGALGFMAATFQRKQPALRAFLAGQILFASRFSTACSPRGAASPSPPDGSQQGRTGATLFNPKGEIIMANIGTFTAEKDGFTGTLRTLTLNVKVKLVPNDKGDNESAPDFRLQAAGHDFGAAWKKTSEAGRDYLSAIDDPSFPATVYARLIEGDGTHDLIWSRQGGLTAATAPPIAAGRGAADRSIARTGRQLPHVPHVQGQHCIGDGRMARSPWQ
jgi:uncharacterized protein (DUF736 family)